MGKTKVRSYTDEELLNRVKELPNYMGMPKGYWILGVRSSEDTENVFDDKFYIYKGSKFYAVLTGTTNPGSSILRGGFLRYNKLGAAILKSDKWHHDIWRYIYRSSRGHELRQVNKCTIYRDGNKDGKSEEIGVQIHGLYGINFHTTTHKWYNSVVKWFVGGWSAGCQVTNERDTFLKWMLLFKKRRESGEQTFVTYCLLKEF